MNSLITVRFDDRDMTDLALMRLRRGGVKFSVIGLFVSGDERRPLGTMEAYSPQYSFSMVNPLGNSDPAAILPMASRAIFGKLESRSVRDTVLKIRLDSDNVGRARDILRSAHGRGIVTTTTVTGLNT